MTSIESATTTIDAAPMGQAAAKQLDKRIQSSVNGIQRNYDVLLELLRQAKTGQVHLTLGFASWTAYLADRVRVTPRSVDERRELVAILSSEGVSGRAIANMTGVSNATVNRDRGAHSLPGNGPTVGLDGKEYRYREPTPRDNAGRFIAQRRVDRQLGNAVRYAQRAYQAFPTDDTDTDSTTAKLAELMAHVAPIMSKLSPAQRDAVLAPVLEHTDAPNTSQPGPAESPGLFASIAALATPWRSRHAS
jgi:Trp operon repressor